MQAQANNNLLNIDETIEVTLFCQRMGVSTKDQIQKLVSNVRILATLNKLKDIPHWIVHKSNISPAAACEDVYCYIVDLEIIMGFHKKDAVRVLSEINFLNIILFKPTTMVGDDFDNFIKYIIDNKNEIRLSKNDFQNIHTLLGK
jgi:hypothetical protein